MLDVKLVVIGGATENDEIKLELPAIVGRARDTTIPLPHPLVSRRHCELFERDGRLIVRDLGSTNGTFVGSERISESDLEHGQLLTIGTVTFRAFFSGLSEPILARDDNETPSRTAFGELTPDPEQETSTILRADTGHIGGVRRPHTASQEAQS
jgi:pSer/pThr/pTyr-binding forkhead associated (FHA) protein